MLNGDLYYYILFENGVAFEERTLSEVSPQLGRISYRVDRTFAKHQSHDTTISLETIRSVFSLENSLKVGDKQCVVLWNPEMVAPPSLSSLGGNPKPTSPLL